jgi:hypothetical protein
VTVDAYCTGVALVVLAVVLQLLEPMLPAVPTLEVAAPLTLLAA